MEKKLVIENEIEQLTQVATFVEEMSEEQGWGPELVFNLNLVLEEAMTNVVMYAYPEGEKHEIWLTAKIQDNTLTLILEDEGAHFDPTQVPDADTTLSAEERPIGGLGIFLIRQMMDDVAYARQEDRNVLTMTKTINQ